MSNAISTRPRALVLGITTAGWDRQSLCYQLYDYGKKVSTGEIDDESFFFRWWEPADPDADYTDPAVWAECNPGIDDFMSAADFEAAAKITPENEFRRYRLNQWTATHSAWLKAGAWDECAKPEYKIANGSRCVLGFDGSWSNDSTALVVCEIGTNHVEVLDAWEKPSNDDTWRVDVADVEEAIRQACKRYKVTEVVCDPSFWKASIQQLAREGLPMVELPNSPQRMIEATKTFEDAIYEKRLSHNGDPRLARHIENCVIKTDRRTDGHYVTKESKNSSRKIDIAIAALMAYSRAAVAKKKQPTVDVLWLDN